MLSVRTMNEATEPQTGSGIGASLRIGNSNAGMSGAARHGRQHRRPLMIEIFVTACFFRCL